MRIVKTREEVVAALHSVARGLIGYAAVLSREASSVSDPDPALTTTVFAERLRRAHEHAFPLGDPEHPPPTQAEIAKAISDNGTRLSQSQVSRLFKGEHKPRYDLIRAFARYYGLPPEYFFAETAEAELQHLEVQRDLAQALADPNIRAITLAACDLSTEGLRKVLDMVNYVRELEKARKR